jgi:hypothetical protein
LEDKKRVNRYQLETPPERRVRIRDFRIVLKSDKSLVRSPVLFLSKTLGQGVSLPPPLQSAS